MARNDKGARLQAKALPMDGGMAEARWAGYNDARRGLGYRREYDAASHFWQINYERGRHQAAAAHAALGGTENDMLHSKAPAWARNRYLQRVLEKTMTVEQNTTHRDLCGPVMAFADMTGTAYARWFA